MSIENHPNLHVVNLMMKIESALLDTLRGAGVNLTLHDRLSLAKDLAETAEERIDRLVWLEEHREKI